jgi:uncharacterized membrane protein YdjX (TVP38/TMEM64 family)
MAKAKAKAKEKAKSNAKTTAEGRGPAWGKILTIVVVLAALTAAWRYTPLSEFITAERVGSWARSVRATPWAPALVIFAYTPASLVMFPRPLLTLFTVIAFGAWLGFLYSMAGVMLAAVVLYYVGRALPRDTIKRVAGEHLDQVTKRLRQHGLLAVFALRMAPVTPFPVDNVIAGAARIRLWDYIGGTFLGMVPGVLATTVFGAQIARIFDDASQMNYWVIAGVVLFFIVATYGAGRWLAKKTKE